MRASEQTDFLIDELSVKNSDKLQGKGTDDESPFELEGRLTGDADVIFTILLADKSSKEKYFWGKIDPSHSTIIGGWGLIFGIKEGSFIVRSVIPGSFNFPGSFNYKVPTAGKGVKSTR